MINSHHHPGMTARFPCSAGKSFFRRCKFIHVEASFNIEARAEEVKPRSRSRFQAPYLHLNQIDTTTIQYSRYSNLQDPAQEGSSPPPPPCAASNATPRDRNTTSAARSATHPPACHSYPFSSGSAHRSTKRSSTTRRRSRGYLAAARSGRNRRSNQPQPKMSKVLWAPL